MFKGNLVSLLVSVTVCVMLIPAWAQVTITPFGMGCGIDGPEERLITISNTGNQDMPYTTRARIHREDERLGGPHRDDPGDLVAHFRPPGGAASHYTTGLSWDAENLWMWNNDFHSGECWALDPADNYQPAMHFNVEARCETMALLNGHLYMIVDPQRYLTHYNRQGDHLDNLNFNFVTYAVTASSELGYLFVMGNDNVIYLYTVQDNGQVAQEVGRISNWSQVIGNADVRSILWVDAHPDGQLWMNTCRGPNGEGGNWAWEVAVDTDDWVCTEVVQVFQTRAGNSPQHWDGLGHDGENLWASFWAIDEIYILDDGVSELRLMEIDPPEGVVPAENDAELFVQLDPTGVDPGLYNYNVQFTFGEGQQVITVMTSVLVSVESEVGNILGTVTRASDGAPLGGALVRMEQYSMERITDAQGHYAFEELPLGQYDLTVTMPEYLPQNLEADLDEEDDIEVDAALLHGECALSIEGVVDEMLPDNESQYDFTAANNGDGTLTYHTERRLLGDANAEPWTLRRSYMVGADREDTAIQGLVYADGVFLASGSGNNNPKIYAFNREGEFLYETPQPRVEGDSRGMRDLAWDGNLLWGCVGLQRNQVFGMRLNGEVVHQFNGPYNPSTGIAWDPDHEVLWICTTTGNPVAYRPDGQPADFTPIPRGNLRIYGLAYWPSDPDGCCLYILHKEQDTNRQAVNKCNVETREMRFVAYLDPEAGGSPEGAYITSSYDVYSWVMMSVANNAPANGGDRIDVWQLDARRDWMSVEPSAGQIEAGGEEAFTLTLNTTDLEQAEYQAEIAFVHDGFGGETTIPIDLNVIIGRVQVERILMFDAGWNMVSLNCEPDVVDVTELFAPMAENRVLLLLKDGQGHFYNPEWDFNNIPGWRVSEGYQARVAANSELLVSGLSMLADDPIPLVRGWQIVAYYPQAQVEAPVGFSNIRDILDIAKNGAGAFYIPAWDFNNIPPLTPGQGYQVKVIQDGELVWALQEEGQRANVRWNQPRLTPDQSTIVATGENMSVLILTDESLTGEVKIFAGEKLVGAGVLANGAAGVAVWGGESLAREGDPLTVSLQTREGETALELTTLAGEPRYSLDGVWVAKVAVVEALPEKFGLVAAYPNPFNAVTKLEWNLLEPGEAAIVLYDLEGRLTMKVASGSFAAGRHTTLIDGEGLAAGVYIAQLTAAGRDSRLKLTILK